MWFSPSGQYLCYIQFNDSQVTWYEFPWYGERNNSYTSNRKIAYPKAGYPNPTVKVQIIDLQSYENPVKTDLHPPNEFQNM